MRFPLLLLAALALSGCSSIVPSSVARLYQVSPLEADPADLAVALDLPETVQVRPGSAKISFSARRSDTGQTSDGVYTLRMRKGTAGQSVFDMAAADIPTLRRQQALIRGWEEEDGDATSGSVSVTFEGCRIGTGPTPDDTVSVLLRTQADGSFFPLVRDATITDALNVLKLDAIERC